MAETDNLWEGWAGNRMEIPFDSIPDENGDEKDLTDHSISFLAVPYSNSGVPQYTATPTLAFDSTDGSPQAEIVNAVSGTPRARVTILETDTSGLVTTKPVRLYCQVEVRETDGGASPVIIATGDLVLKPNIPQP